MDDDELVVADREVFAVEDAHGDVVRVVEWGRPHIGSETIGCIQFSDDEGEDGPTVHLRADAALQLGEKLVAWAKSRGAGGALETPSAMAERLVGSERSSTQIALREMIADAIAEDRARR